MSSDAERVTPPGIDKEPGNRPEFLEWMAEKYEGELKGRVARALLQASESEGSH